MPTINDLPADQLRYLANSAEFSEFISDDPELDRLDTEKYDPAMELRMISELSGSCFYGIGNAVFPPIFPLLLSWLWLLNSPFVTGAQPTEPDADIFFFLLKGKSFSGTVSELAKASSGFCRRSGISFDTALREISELKQIAFHPLTFFPPSGSDSADSRNMYDADWLSHKVCIAAKESLISAAELMYSPLSAVLWYYIQWYRRTFPDQNVRRRTPEEISNAIMERTHTLAVEFLKMKGKI